MYKDRAKYLAAQLRYNEAHREDRRILSKEWRKKNKIKHRTYQKIYIKSRPDIIFREKARQKLKYAVKIGKIKRLPCKKCGEIKSSAHHDDYTEPLKVKWLCFIHHGEVHRKYK